MIGRFLLTGLTYCKYSSICTGLEVCAWWGSEQGGRSSFQSERECFNGWNLEIHCSGL